MNPILRAKKTTSLYVLIFAVAALSPAPKAFGVLPPPDGGYPGLNTAEGKNALLSLTTGTGNTAVGFNSLKSATTSSYSTAVGAGALALNNADQNTAIGTGALLFNSTGSQNTADGAFALANNTTGTSNTANGHSALQSNTTGNFNTANGDSALLSNTTGSDNTANGNSALFSNTTGFNNNATGVNALGHNTTGFNNNATGDSALFNNTTGNDNNATGAGALFSNTTGIDNNATGVDALTSNTTGSKNAAYGDDALKNNTTGNRNTALGNNAGRFLTTGSNNIDIGDDVEGIPGESNKIRIGVAGTQDATFIAGISGVPVTGSQVMIDSNGQLGITGSSARFKQAIKPMEKASEAILALKPVTFRYKKEIDPEGRPQFGLVAEDVEKVDPALVARDAEGKVFTVRYEQVNAMLLNEFLKAYRRMQDLEARDAQQEKQIETLTRQLGEQAAQIQKVNAQRELRERGPEVATNNP